ncbi:hypothetical protein M1B72_12700 [Geomonas paludis]|uniref:Lipoprotein n=1 Tax=Geomonas paludis TaxID=2740185 RepID=A0A6V8MW70_9BACT|nr:hypothetical protein [Geomonas paludis]UPU34309.1 hypothetical protein M1B72_12700 [Geomonas paludis]GFO64291.1 hypothetical protein GMPD_22100 [Geomonas paludis]
MKELSLICLVLASLLTACTNYMYGVPQESWDRMSETERVEAIRVYEQEQRARRQAEEEQARRQAVERERERARRAALERERQERIDAIHRGEGAFGELIRVRLQGGEIKIGDRHHHYQPLTFTIADGETRRIAVADRKGRETELTVTYAGGALSFEGLRFPYDRRWGRGELYTDTGTSGPLALRGVDVFIQVHDRSSRFDREMPRLIIVREEPPVVIRERERERERERSMPPPAIIVEKDRPKPQPVTPPPPPVRQPAPPLPVRQPAPPPPVRQPASQPPVGPPASQATVHPPRTVAVALLSGELKVRGKKQQVEQSALRIADGETRELQVKSGAETRTISVQYRNGELLINEPPGKGRNDIRLRFEKDWKTGKIYRFDLKGRTGLEKVEMRVTGVE